MFRTLSKFEGTPSARPVTNASQVDPYRPTWSTIRPGSDDHEKVPSRINDTLTYRDGQVEQLP